MTKRILFIVEGRRTEPRFLKKIMSVLGLADEKEIYSVGTNIHALYESIFGDGDPEDTDLLLALKSRTTDVEDRKILSGSYSDVFLVFDVEVQDADFDESRMIKLLNHFSNSTENGKLYLNYPMMESIRHLKKLDDCEYVNSTVKLHDIPQYKRIVGEEGCAELKNPNGYDAQKMRTVALRNAEKYLSLTCNGNTSPLLYEECDSGLLFELQMEHLRKEDELFIINTSVLVFVDMNPPRFFSDTYPDV